MVARPKLVLSAAGHHHLGIHPGRQVNLDLKLFDVRLAPVYACPRGQIRLLLVPPTGQVAGNASINRWAAANKKRI
jgi:hypothetical protein